MNIETFKKLFTVDPTPRTEKVGDTYTSYFNFEKQHKFNMSNRQAIENGSVVEEGKLRDYLNEVVFLLYDTLKPSEIPDFLDYHYENSTEKTEFLRFVKYDLWELYPLNKNEAKIQNRKSVIHEWLAGQKTQPQKTKPLPSLEDMFIDKKQLTKLVEVLIEKGFVEKKETGSLYWTGIQHDRVKGSGLQFIALSFDVCKPLYKKTDYQQKEIHHAWTTYFNFYIAQNMYSDVKRPQSGSEYHKLFNNLLTLI